MNPFSNLPPGYSPLVQMQIPDHYNQVPARISVAMGYLVQVTHKTADHVFPTSMGTLQEIPGQKLTEEEVWAQRAACDLLVKYFAGTMELSNLERLDQAKSDVLGSADKPGMIIRCFACTQKDRIDDNCIFCHGEGNLLIFPVESARREL